MHYPTDDNDYLSGHVALVLASYRNLLSEELLPDAAVNPKNLANCLFHAPFAVLSHTTDDDPLFNYANLKALELFGFHWEGLIGLPSRLSAEPAAQADRDRLLKEVGEKGYIKDYQGIRLTKQGKRFLINNAVVWNLRDISGNFAGQAACIKEWQFL